jgi:hypothetical protein
MLDGRINEQGIVSDLEASGALKMIAQDAKMHVTQEVKEENLQEPTADVAATAVTLESDTKPKSAPRKLIQDEERQEGAVKWPIYKKYLEASCVTCLMSVFVTKCLLCSVHTLSGS